MQYLVIISLVIFGLTHGQEPCSPIDPGPYVPVNPVLYVTVYEASEQELVTAPNDLMYQSELRLHGVIDDSSPSGIILETMQDFRFVDPTIHFVFETVSGKNFIRLVKSVDRDGPTESIEDDINIETFTLKCSPASNTSKEEYFTVSVLFKDKNDNPPTFVNTPYETTVNEVIPIGTTVLSVTAVDKDSNLDGNLTYSVVKRPGIMNDGGNVFSVDTLTGALIVADSLDYEALGINNKYYDVSISAVDGGPGARFTSHTTVKVHVTDGDDQGPTFDYKSCYRHKGACIWPVYLIDVNSAQLNVPIQWHGFPDVTGNPVAVMARDMDSLAAEIKFSIISTSPVGYQTYFSVETIDRGNGKYEAVVQQIKHIDDNVFTGLFQVFLKAEENTTQRRHAVGVVEYLGKIVQNKDKTTNAPKTTDSAYQSKTDTKPPNEEYTDTIIALIVVVAVTLTLVVCLAIAFAVLACRRNRSSKEALALAQNGLSGSRSSNTHF